MNHARVFRLDIALPVIVASAGLFGTIYADVPVIRGLATISLIGVMALLIAGSITLTKIESEDARPLPPVKNQTSLQQHASRDDEADAAVLTSLASEIQWERERLRLVDVVQRLTQPVEYSKTAMRSGRLHEYLATIGVKCPSYGDPLWGNFFIILYHYAEAGDLQKARTLLDDLAKREQT